MAVAADDVDPIRLRPFLRPISARGAHPARTIRGYCRSVHKDGDSTNAEEVTAAVTIPRSRPAEAGIVHTRWGAEAARASAGSGWQGYKPVLQGRPARPVFVNRSVTSKASARAASPGLTDWRRGPVRRSQLQRVGARPGHLDGPRRRLVHTLSSSLCSKLARHGSAKQRSAL